MTQLVLWEQPAHEPRDGVGPPVPSRKLLLASSGTTGLWALATDDGREVWRRALPDGGVSAPVPIAGAVMVSTTRYGVFLFSPLDGGVIDGLDLSPGMLVEARGKGVYGELREGTLGDELAYDTGDYDGVVAAGVLTTGHAPASSLDELVRITRPGGLVIFTLRSDQGGPPGFAEKMEELADSRRWELVERGDEFQAMPVGEPEVLVRVWAFRVL